MKHLYSVRMKLKLTKRIEGSRVQVQNTTLYLDQYNHLKFVYIFFFFSSFQGVLSYLADMSSNVLTFSLHPPKILITVKSAETFHLVHSCKYFCKISGKWNYSLQLYKFAHQGKGGDIFQM